MYKKNTFYSGFYMNFNTINPVFRLILDVKVQSWSEARKHVTGGNILQSFLNPGIQLYLDPPRFSVLFLWL